MLQAHQWVWGLCTHTHTQRRRLGSRNTSDKASRMRAIIARHHRVCAYRQLIHGSQFVRVWGPNFAFPTRLRLAPTTTKSTTKPAAMCRAPPLGHRARLRAAARLPANPSLWYPERARAPVLHITLGPAKAANVLRLTVHVCALACTRSPNGAGPTLIVAARLTHQCHGQQVFECAKALGALEARPSPGQYNNCVLFRHWPRLLAASCAQTGQLNFLLDNKHTKASCRFCSNRQHYINNFLPKVCTFVRPFKVVKFAHINE